MIIIKVYTIVHFLLIKPMKKGIMYINLNNKK